MGACFPKITALKGNPRDLRTLSHSWVTQCNELNLITFDNDINIHCNELQCIVTLQRTTWNSIGNSCNVYDKTHGTSKVGECKNVTTELIFVIPLVLSLKILSGRNFYVFRVAFMRTFQKVLFLQPAYLFSTQNATQRNSTFKVYPELEQLQKAVRRDQVLSSFSFCLKNWQNDSMEGFLARRPWKTIFTFNLNAAARLFLSFADIHNYYIFKNCLSGQLGLPLTPLTWLCETTAR